jgi:lipid-A-disaccharide synthase
MRVFISAGEASGDLYGAALATHLLALGFDVTGLGGSKMAALGLPLIGDSSRWGSISIVQSVREGLRGIGTYRRLKATLLAGPPGVFVPIDFGYMNLRLCRWARQAGWKILYFIPPGSWRRDRQGADIPKLADEVVTNFPWSADLLRQMGATAHFYGHPLLEIHAEVLKSDLPRSGLAVLPGSRRSELEQLLPILGQALSDYPGSITIPVPPRHIDLVRRRWNRSSDQIIDGSKDGAVIGTLKSAERAVVCSGTATLEAALAKTPMVAIYRVSKMVEIETKIVGFKRPEFVSQPNILLQREVVPELIQEDLSPATLRETLNNFDVGRQLQGFDEIEALLSPSTCLTQTVELIQKLAAQV